MPLRNEGVKSQQSKTLGLHLLSSKALGNLKLKKYERMWYRWLFADVSIALEPCIAVSGEVECKASLVVVYLLAEGNYESAVELKISEPNV